MKKESSQRSAIFSWRGVFYALKVAWKEERFLLLLLLLRIPALVLLPFSSIYLSKLVVQLVTERAQASDLFFQVGLLVLGMILLNVYSSYATSMCRNREVVFEARFNHKVFYKVMDTDYENIESPEGQMKRQKAYTRDYSGFGIGLREILESFVAIAASVSGFLMYGSLLAMLNPRITIFLIAITTLNYFVMTSVRKYEAGYVKRRAVYERRLRYLRNQTSDVRNGKDIRLYRMEPWLTALFKDELKSRDHEIWLFVKRQVNAMIFGHGLVFLRDGLAYVYLIYLVIVQRLRVDEFVLYFGLIAGFSTWIVDLVDQVNYIARSGLIVDNVRAYLSLPDRLNRGPGIPLPQGCEKSCSLAFSDVTFTYPGANYPTFEHLEFTVAPKEKLAIVGVNGAGKTTLVKLLCGLYCPDEGKVLVNGKSAQEYNRDEYYTMFSTAFQDVHVLPMSIAQNVAMCPEEGIDRERVWTCLRKAGLEEKVRSYQRGLDTVLVKSVSKEALDLSGGEQQKLVFARALYRDAPILVLDEPTAALDPIAENQMYLRYNEVAKDKTSIFISHRLSSTRFCDRILFFDEGRIAEMGTHDELMALGGKYAEMFEIQSQYYRENGGNAHEQA